MAESPALPHRIGLISDTHGRLDPRVATALEGVERILHAGDIGSPEILWELGAIAPVTAVRGNTDHWETAGEDLPGLAHVTLDSVRILLVHDRHDLGSQTAEETDVVVFGHSHVPAVYEQGGVLWVNPGSASRPRQPAPGASVGVLEIAENERPRAFIVPLADLGADE